MPPSDVMLLKLVWHPGDISDEGDRVLPTAFSKTDLSGKPDDHVSVDRSDIAKRFCMEAVAAGQKANPNVVREDALIGRIHCGSVRSISYLDALALGVISAPIAGNDAHCGIQNITTAKGRGYLDEVRGKLAKLASPPITFDEAYRDAS